MTTLSDFLLARIAEDEEAANARHATKGRWAAGGLTRIGAGTVGTYWRVGVPNRRDQIKVPLAYVETRDDARHMARHDPARVLAECEAKRQIVAEHANGWDTSWVDPDDPDESEHWYCVRCGHEKWPDQPSPWPCLTLRALALPYADHPDYREEWKP